MIRILGFSMAILVIMGVLLGVHLWRLPHGDLVVDFLDIGQGDAILITTPDQHRILIDGGPEQFVLEELGEVLPFLHKKIDFMILSHPHADHMMGLVQVLQRYEVMTVLFTGVDYGSPIYDEFLKEIRLQEIPLYVARSDQDWGFGEVEFDVLFPFESMLGKKLDNVNNGSAVIMVQYRGHEILLTGDAEHEVEEELIKVYEGELRAEIMKAGHHGSRTASSGAFLEEVQPNIVVIQVGKDNQFEHPHPEIMGDLTRMGITIYRNDLDGRVRLRLN